MKVLVINGPNINMLGIREPEIYGNKNYNTLINEIHTHAADISVSVELYQSNHEGCIVDKIQAAYGNFDAIVINPAAYTHTSIAILDALKSVGLPCVEVHISDVSIREEFRQISYVRQYCEKTIMGQGFNGYLLALDYLKEKYEK